MVYLVLQSSATFKVLYTLFFLQKLSYMEGLVTKDKKDLEQKLKLLQRDNNNMLDELEKRDDELVKLRTHGGTYASKRFFPMSLATPCYSCLPSCIDYLCSLDFCFTACLDEFSLVKWNFY